jgi:hypothetical protein
MYNETEMKSGILFFEMTCGVRCCRQKKKVRQKYFN